MLREHEGAQVLIEVFGPRQESEEEEDGQLDDKVSRRITVSGGVLSHGLFGSRTLWTKDSRCR